MAEPGDVSASVTLSALTQLNTHIDQGGRFRWSAADVAASFSRQFSAEASAGISARYVSEHWSFTTPTAFGPMAPWTTVERPSIGLNVGYNLGEDLSLFVAPQFEWAYASGGSAADALNYGAVVGVTQVFSPKLFVGLGLGAFRQIDRNQYFPFIIVNWQITDTLRLSNPLQAGPAGGAGLELAYSDSETWEFAAGAAYRDYRFRLRSDGPIPGGLGQNQGAPVFARLTRKFGPIGQIDLYAGWVVGGKLRVLDSTGATLQSSGYGAAPLLALSGTINF
jgi:hypothetical protein